MLATWTLCIIVGVVGIGIILTLDEIRLELYGIKLEIAQRNFNAH